MNRTSMYFVYALALAAGIGSALIVLAQFIEYLQTGAWPHLSLLRVAIDWQLIPSNWGRYPEIADAMFSLLRSIPVSIALLAMCPLIWWIGNGIKRRI